MDYYWHSIIPAIDTALAAIGLLVYVITTQVRQQRRRPSAALAWVLFIMVAPYFGLPAFLMFGTRKVVRPGAPSQAAPLGFWNNPEQAPAWSVRLLAALNVSGPVPAQAVTFQSDGKEALDALMALIESAEFTLDVCTYVLARDAVGRAIAQKLADRAHAGVRVRLLVDAIGSIGKLHVHDHLLIPAGVRRRAFMPLLLNPRRGHTNLRNHRKFVIADNARVWSGGRNLASEYFTGHHGRHGRVAWRDLSFTAHGLLALQARAIFESDWRIAPGLRRAPRADYAQWVERLEVQREKWLAQASYKTTDPKLKNQTKAIKQHRQALIEFQYPTQSEVVALAQWVPSGPDCHADNLHALLVSAITHAEQRVLLVTPYFVPDEALLDALILAARREVRVLLLIPKNSNHKLADLARGRAIRALASAGAEVYLLEQMLHAKAVVIDNTLALCGSANLDGRSLFINFEAMVAFYGSEQINWLADWITSTANGAPRASAHRPPWWHDLLEGIVGAVAFQL
jgi:cardiolipin synthase